MRRCFCRLCAVVRGALRAVQGGRNDGVQVPPFSLSDSWIGGAAQLAILQLMPREL